MSDLDTCLLARFPGPRVPGWLRRWLDYGLGGVLLFAENITGRGSCVISWPSSGRTSPGC